MRRQFLTFGFWRLFPFVFNRIRYDFCTGGELEWNGRAAGVVKLDEVTNMSLFRRVHFGYVFTGFDFSERRAFVRPFTDSVLHEATTFGIVRLP